MASHGNRTRQEVALYTSWGILRGRTVRDLSFGLLVALTLGAFWAPLRTLIQFSFQQEHYSHIILVPLISTSLLFLERRAVFSHGETRWVAGLSVLFAGGLLYWLEQRHFASASENDRLSIAIFAVVVVWVGGFVLCYGVQALHKGLFPVLLLFLMVPIPDFFLSRAILWLQIGSAEVSYAVFELVGVPVFRTGLIFSLPGVTIEVAKECSGIRSSVALLIIGLLAGHLLLRSAWTKALLILAALPLLIVKNGIRIVTLSLLSIYVDPGFLAGSLHHKGGIAFFLLALALLAPVLWLLQRSERSKPTNAV